MMLGQKTIKSSRCILLSMRNVSDISCIESHHTFYVQYLFLENCAVCEIEEKYCRGREAAETM
jgi:hypothetical protein